MHLSPTFQRMTRRKVTAAITTCIKRRFSFTAERQQISRTQTVSGYDNQGLFFCCHRHAMNCFCWSPLSIFSLALPSDGIFEFSQQLTQTNRNRIRSGRELTGNPTNVILVPVISLYPRDQVSFSPPFASPPKFVLVAAAGGDQSRTQCSALA